MDRLELFVAEYDNPYFQMNGQKGEVVEYFINGRNLLEVLEECFKMENKSFNKYEYIGIRPEDVFLPSVHLLGHPLWTNCRQTLIYTCSGCGIPGCASVHIQVTVKDDSVIWNNFTRAARVADDDCDGVYFCERPVFQFDLQDYKAALRYHSARKVHGLIIPDKSLLIIKK